MSFAKYTKHTTLVKITSIGSGGRAEIICGHPAVTKGFSDPHLTNARFRKYAVGQHLVIHLKLKGKRRLIMNVGDSELYNIETPMAISRFQDTNSVILQEEARLFNQINPNLKEEETSVGTIKEPTSGPTSFEEGKIWIDKKTRNLFNTVLRISKTKHVSVMMIGPSGYGKTSIPEQIAKENELEYVRINCANITEPEEIFGYRGAKDGSTMDENGDPIFIKSEFSKKLEQGNCVIVLDEINRLEPYIVNPLFALLDHAGTTNILGRDFTVGPNIVFVGTMNLGYKFTGTFQVDAALMNRFTASVQVGPLPKTKEVELLESKTSLNNSQAFALVDVLTSLRKLSKTGKITADVSTRVSIQLASLMDNGLSLKDAIYFGVMTSVSDEESKLIVDTVGMALS